MVCSLKVAAVYVFNNHVASAVMNFIEVSSNNWIVSWTETTHAWIQPTLFGGTVLLEGWWNYKSYRWWINLAQTSKPRGRAACVNKQ